MPELPIAEIADAINGTPEHADSGLTFAHFHFDTRLIEHENTLFFAIKSPESGIDGHDYVHRLEGKTGAGAVVSREFDASGLTLPLVRVDHPLKAAQQLALYVRNKHRHIKYIGVTGSAGKTTTKEFIYQLLARKYKTYRSFKNWNNWIGVPFSLLNMKGDEEAAVFELAMSDPGIGEIDLLARILRPDAAVILNVFPVHMEFLKTLDNAAIAKCEILNYMEADDAAFINADNLPLAKRLQEPDMTRGRKIFFGQKAGNPQTHIRLTGIQRKGKQTRMTVDFYGIPTHFVTPLVNRIHLENLFVAIIVAQHLGMKNVEIQEALKEIAPLAGRGVIYSFKGFTIVDETYNSNPEALKRALEWVDKEYKGRKIAIVGDMLELGEKEAEYHRDVGRYAAGLGFERFITVGKRAAEIAEGLRLGGKTEEMVRRFDTAAEAGKYLQQVAGKECVLLFKASRGIRLETAIEEFKHG
jgi:UDP-N-acetylmuramoyl-tripeptide--D-alanyl-D-alanine ligase